MVGVTSAIVDLLPKVDDGGGDGNVLLGALPWQSRAGTKEVFDVALKDLYAALSTKDLKLAHRATKRVSVFFQVKGSVSLETRAELLNVMFKLVNLDCAGLVDQTKLLKRMGEYLAIRRVGLEEHLKIKWKDLFRILKKVHIRPGESRVLGSKDTVHKHVEALTSICFSMLQYYDQGVVQEVWDFAKGYFSDSLSRDLYLGQAILYLFLPSVDSESYVSLVEHWILKEWEKLDSSDWNTTWLCLTLRALRHGGIQAIKNKPGLMLPLYCHIQKSLHLTPPSGFKIPPRTNRPGYLSSIIGHSSSTTGATIAVLLLGYGTAQDYFHTEDNDVLTSNSKDELARSLEQYKDISAGALFLRQLLNSVQTLYHPSNSRRYASVVGSFTNALCKAFSSRLGCERVPEKWHFVTIPKPDKELFVATLLPLLEMGIYAKARSVTNSAQSCISHLAYIAPITIAEYFFPIIGDALDPNNLNQTHQAPAVIKLIAVLVQPLLQVRPLLAPNLPELLELTLPGLDPNDVTKTMTTCMFYQVVLSWVPIIDVEEEKLDYPENIISSKEYTFTQSYGVDLEEKERQYEDDAPLRDAMWRGNASIVAWSLQVLDRLLLFIDSLVARAKRGFAAQLDNAVFSGMAMTGRLLFAQMCPSVRKRAGKRITEWVLTSCNLVALRESKSLLRSYTASFVSGQDTVEIKQIIMVGLFEPLLTRAADERETSDRQLEWSLVLLGAMSRVLGEYLLPYERDLNKAIDLALAHKEVQIRKIGGKLLRRVIRGLAEHYIPSRSSSSLIQNDKDSAGYAQMAVNWGKPEAWRDTMDGVQWHKPSERERSMALRLKDKYMSQALNDLNQAMEQDAPNLTFRSKLEVLFQVVRGSCVLMTKQDERVELLEKCCGMLYWLLKHRESDSTSHRRIMKVMQLLFVCYGGQSSSSKKMNSRKVWSSYMRESMISVAYTAELELAVESDIVKDKADWVVPRYHQVDELQTLLLLQTFYLSFEAAQDAKDNGNEESTLDMYLDALSTACVHDWKDTRRASLKVMKSWLSRVPWYAKPKMLLFIEKLKTSESYGVMCGAASVLYWSKAADWVAQDMRLLDGFIRTVVFDCSVQKLPEDKRKETNESIQNVVVDILLHWSISKRLSETEESIRVQLIKDITSKTLTSALHWREQIIICASLAALVRPGEGSAGGDESIDLAVLDWASQRTMSDMLPLRIIASSLFVRLLVSSSDGRGLVGQLKLEDNFFETLGNTISQSHGAANVGVDGNSKGLKAKSDWSTGVNELRSVCRFPGAAYFPRTCVPGHSKELSFAKSLQIASLVGMLGQERSIAVFCPVLKELFFEGVDTAEYHSRRIAGCEILCGLLSCQDTCSSEALREIAVSSFNESSLEAAGLWLDTFRLAEACHESYIVLFADRLVEVLNEAHGSTTVDVKLSILTANLLRMMRTLYYEVKDKNLLSQVREELLPRLLENMGHLYENVRREIGRVVVTFFDVCVRRGLPDDWVDSSISAFVAVVNGKPREKQADVYSRSLETLLHIAGAVVLFGGPLREKYTYRFVSTAIEAQGHPNVEVGKKASNCATAIASVSFRERETAFKTIQAICDSLEKSPENWYARSAAVQMFGSLYMLNGFVLGYALGKIHTRKEIEKMLRDPQVEVQNVASGSLTLVLSSYQEKDESLKITNMRYLKLCNTKLKRDQYKTDDGKAKLKKRNTGVLGLAALAGAFPYTVPFPDAVVALARRVNNPRPVGPTAKQAILSFKRTHADSWQKSKLAFTSDELEDLQDSSFSLAHA